MIYPLTDTPQAGFYRMRLVRGGPVVAVRIWFGAPVIDGEEQDRAPQWCVEIDGKSDRWEIDDDTGYRCRVPLDVDMAWPRCAWHPVDRREYDFLLRRKTWAVEHAPEHPAANPHQPVDVRHLKPGF